MNSVLAFLNSQRWLKESVYLVGIDYFIASKYLGSVKRMDTTLLDEDNQTLGID